jgi:hypothetical protein
MLSSSKFSCNWVTKIIFRNALISRTFPCLLYSIFEWLAAPIFLTITELLHYLYNGADNKPQEAGCAYAYSYKHIGFVRLCLRGSRLQWKFMMLQDDIRVDIDKTTYLPRCCLVYRVPWPCSRGLLSLNLLCPMPWQVSMCQEIDALLNSAVGQVYRECLFIVVLECWSVLM